MTSRLLAAIVAACLLVAPGIGAAQTTSGDVTFRLPLNLTQLSSDIAKIAVNCNIKSDAIPSTRTNAKGMPVVGMLSKQVEFPVTGGELVTTATIVVPVSGLDSPVGKTANYDCLITGYSTALQQWAFFDGESKTASLRLTPTPPRITGSFVW